MTKKTTKKLIVSIKNGQKAISGLTKLQKKTLEKEWDIEHAYYSSALEGSKLDRKEFEKFAKEVS